MVSNKKDNVLAVLSLSGGNDGLNTIIPRSNGLYHDLRPNLGISEELSVIIAIVIKEPQQAILGTLGTDFPLAPQIIIRLRDLEVEIQVLSPTGMTLLARRIFL